MRENARKEGDYIISEDVLGTSYKHPSFGMLSFSRTHGGHSNLFGSSIQHNDTIHMVLKEKDARDQKKCTNSRSYSIKRKRLNIVHAYALCDKSRSPDSRSQKQQK